MQLLQCFGLGQNIEAAQRPGLQIMPDFSTGPLFKQLPESLMPEAFNHNIKCKLLVYICQHARQGQPLHFTFLSDNILRASFSLWLNRFISDSRFDAALPSILGINGGDTVQ